MSDIIPPRSTVRGLVSACALALFASGTAMADEDGLGTYFERLPRGVPSIQQSAAVPRATTYRRAKAAPMQRAAFTTTARVDARTLERSAFTLINLHRITNGMRPLDNHSGLADRARGHSRAMAAGTAPMNHDGMRDRLSPYLGGLFGSSGGGEILAFNRNMGDPARTAMMSWLNSYRHKDIIEEHYTRMGVGVAMRPDGGYYFTVLFLQ